MVALSVGLLLVASLGGCQKGQRQVAPAEVQAVPVAHPVQRQITDFVDFTGRTAAVNSVNIIPRVTGYLVQMPFKEGSEVKKGDLLFEIDPRPYQAQFDQAKAQVVLNQASLELAKSTLARYEALDKSTPGAVSKQALDQYQAAVVEAEARVETQVKSLEVYRLNKEFTRIESPIDGQVSRYYLTLGNLVNQDQTLLTTIVSLDPMYAYFDMDERTLLNIRKALAEGRIVRYVDGESIPLLMGLENEEGFPHHGTINFVNNQVNSTTGSITLRGVFANPTPAALPAAGATAAPAASVAASPKQQNPAPAAGAAGTPQQQDPAAAATPAKGPRPLPRLLSPGMFLRVRLPIGQAHSALLIIDRAIQSDQGLKYVYVVDAQNKVQYRRVTTGALQEDGLRAVDGVKPEEWVVVGALQQVRPRMEIKPEQGPMPSLRSQADGTGHE
jgi:multidrug efflux system membrane fusion protein